MEEIGSLVFGTLAERLTAMQMPSSITEEARKLEHHYHPALVVKYQGSWH